MAPYDPMGTGRRRRGCCYCCCGTKKRTFTCLLITALIIVGIVLVCYFFIPRRPAFCFTVGYPNSFRSTNTGVSASIPVNVSVDNPNYYGFSLGDTTVNALHLNTISGNYDILSTVNAPKIHITARGNSTTSFTITVDGSAGTTEDYAQILNNCTPSGTTTLYLNATITLLHHIHINVPNQAIAIQCSTVSILGGGAALVTNNSSQSSYFCKKT